MKTCSPTIDEDWGQSGRGAGDSEDPIGAEDLAQGGARAEGVARPILAGHFLPGPREDLGLRRPGYDDHAVGVARDEVARRDGHAVEGDRDVEVDDDPSAAG